MDVQQLVKAVLQDAITAAGLGHMLKCYNELSIFKLRPDIWVVMNDRGVPVGVCEVKKPGRSIINSSFVHGQIYDYMLRLRSFHGLRYVFGIVSTYEQWRLYWLDDCAAAASASVSAPASSASPASPPPASPLSLSASPAVADDAPSEHEVEPHADGESKQPSEDLCQLQPSR